MSDQLNEYLASNYSPYYISGSGNGDILMWGTTRNSEMIPGFISLNVGIDYNPLSYDFILTKKQISNILNQRISAQEGSSSFSTLFRIFRLLAQRGSLPCIFIAYPTLPQFASSEWKQTSRAYPLQNIPFYVWDLRNQEAGLLTGTQLKQYIYSLLNVNYTDQGTGKAENKSIHDYFHYWSRHFLSAHVRKLDCDGILFDYSGRHCSLIEIKRSAIPPIPQWRPYIDDENNYRNQLAFAQRLGAQFWLLQHEGKSPITENGQISFYDIAGIDEYQAQRLRHLQMQTGRKQFGDYLACRRAFPLLPVYARDISVPSLHSVMNSFIYSNAEI